MCAAAVSCVVGMRLHVLSVLCLLFVVMLLLLLLLLPPPLITEQFEEYLKNTKQLHGVNKPCGSQNEFLRETYSH